jgi:hypothetical protein
MYALTASTYSTGDVMLFAILVLCIILVVFGAWGRWHP